MTDDTKMTRRPCSIEGCERSVLARGWCSTHYKRFRTHGDPLTVRKPGPARSRATCSVDGCDKTVTARGWCPMHYARWQRHRDATRPGLSDLRHLDDLDEIVDRPRGYEDVKELAGDLGVYVDDLLVLARGNDPFYLGTPSERQNAEWFANLFERRGYRRRWEQEGRRVHNRRIHYAMFGEPKPDGTRYGPDDDKFLDNARKCAVVLFPDRVPIEAFDDRMHKDAQRYLHAPVRDDEPEPQWSWERPEMAFPAILLRPFLFDRPQPPTVGGYDYDDADQSYLVEVWVEKTTMNDVLVPLCQALGVGLVPSSGFQSVVNAARLLERAQRTGKPARVFYISDYDPAGERMPVAVARHLEFWSERYDLQAEVKLHPLVLTGEQVERLELPRAPLTEGDTRNKGWIARRGEDRVELDALEVRQPGELARIVRKAVAPYRDEDLWERLDEAEQAAQNALDSAWQAATAERRGELGQTRDRMAAVVDSYRERVTALGREMQAELEPLEEEARQALDAVEEATEALEVEMPERPEADLDEPDEEEWLFSSDRSYREQLESYREHER